MPPKKVSGKAVAQKCAGSLTVKVVRANSLTNVDTGIAGVSDPYVVVRLGKTEKKTSAVKNNLNPEWSKDNSFTFEAPSVDDSFELEVMDENNFKSHTSLGKLSIGLKNLKKNVMMPLRRKLEGESAGEGELEFEVCFHNAPPIDVEATKARYTKLLEAMADKAPENVKPYVKQAAPVVANVVVYIMVALPYIIHAITVVSEPVAKLPEEAIYACLGFILCFFGGVFPATIAAAEAWRLCGGMEALESCKVLYQEFKKANEASASDDQLDADGDGVADVDQIDSSALLVRKIGVAVKVIEPESVNGAIACIFTGWMGVLATLKIKFARTITLGQVIGEYTYKVASKVEPMVKPAVPEEYQQWIPVAVQWACKMFAISVAWWAERIISAVHSAIRGGLMFARCLLAYLHRTGKVTFPNAEESYIDEAVGWGIAFLGFCFQFMMGFSAPFPLNIVLLPVSFVEYFVVWSVSAS